MHDRRNYAIDPRACDKLIVIPLIPHFCYKMAPCRIWDGCMMGFMQQVSAPMQKAQTETVSPEHVFCDTVHNVTLSL